MGQNNRLLLLRPNPSFSPVVSSDSHPENALAAAGQEGAVYL